MPLAVNHKRGFDHQHPWHLSNVSSWNPVTDLRFGSLDKQRGGRVPRSGIYTPYVWVRDELESRNIQMNTLRDWKEVYGSCEPSSSPVLFRQSKSHPQLQKAHQRLEVKNSRFGDQGLAPGEKDWLGKKMNSLSDWFEKYGRPDEEGQMMTSAVTRDRESDVRVARSQEQLRRTSAAIRAYTLRHHPMLYRAKNEELNIEEKHISELI